MEELAGQRNAPPTMLSAETYRELLARTPSELGAGADEDVITSVQCRALIELFVTLVNASPFRRYGFAGKVTEAWNSLAKNTFTWIFWLARMNYEQKEKEPNIYTYQRISSWRGVLLYTSKVESLHLER